MIIAAILTLLLIATSSINSAYLSLLQESVIPNQGTIPAMFEIELLGTDDTHSLYNEPGIGALATVQQTPRYGVSGEAWVDGVWINSLFFDTTLSDRFVVKCTEEKAINMSSYAWVEWTAPIMEGTIYDGEYGIFFEYGAESGVLQPPWDIVGQVGSPNMGVTTERAGTIVDTAHTRTGTKSMKLYQPDPSKDDSERRISNQIWETQNEFYLSWWVYYDNVWETTDLGGTQGGIQSFFGPSDWTYKWWTAGRFLIHGESKYFMFRYVWGKHANAPNDFSSDAKAIEQTWNNFPNGTKYYVTDHLNTWIHFQIYIKWTTDTTGAITTWIDGDLFSNKTGIITNPSGYSEWGENSCVFHHTNTICIVIELYQSLSSPASHTWVDDVVASTQKVPEDYGVIGK